MTTKVSRRGRRSGAREERKAATIAQRPFKQVTYQYPPMALLSPDQIGHIHATALTILEEVGIDSMGLVEAIFAIEEAFDIQIPFNANEPDAGDFDISSVSAIVTAVEKLVSEQKA